MNMHALADKITFALVTVSNPQLTDKLVYDQHGKMWNGSSRLMIGDVRVYQPMTLRIIFPTTAADDYFKGKL
jgi:hypothetical protein